VPEVQQVIVERHRGVLYQQADAVQHGEEDDLTRDTRTLPGPEGPVAVAQKGNDRRDDGGDRGGRDWSDAEVDEQRVVDGVGNEDAGYADHRELGELATELLEPLVGHLGMIIVRRDSRTGHGRPQA
jgi:hypothetical protein